MTYKIGLSLGTLGAVTDLAAGATDPFADYFPWVSRVKLANDVWRAQGRPRATWTWVTLSEELIAALRSLCPGPSVVVYIETLSNLPAGTFAQYRATMVWPEELDQLYWRPLSPVVFHFNDLVLQP